MAWNAAALKSKQRRAMSCGHGILLTFTITYKLAFPFMLHWNNKYVSSYLIRSSYSYMLSLANDNIVVCVNEFIHWKELHIPMKLPIHSVLHHAIQMIKSIHCIWILPRALIAWGMWVENNCEVSSSVFFTKPFFNYFFLVGPFWAELMLIVQNKCLQWIQNDEIPLVWLFTW